MENGKDLKKKLEDNKLLITLGPKPVRHESNLRSIAKKEPECLEEIREPQNKEDIEIEDITFNVFGGGKKK